MPFDPVKPGGWNNGELLTAAQITSLQAQVAQAAGGPVIEEFTSDGTWTKPAAAKWVTFILVGAGGIGGAGEQSIGDARGGGGAGSGYLYQVTLPAENLAASFAVTLGVSNGARETTVIGGGLTIRAEGGENGTDGTAGGGNSDGGRGWSGGGDGALFGDDAGDGGSAGSNGNGSNNVFGEGGEGIGTAIHAGLGVAGGLGGASSSHSGGGGGGGPLPFGPTAASGQAGNGTGGSPLNAEGGEGGEGWGAGGGGGGGTDGSSGSGGDGGEGNPGWAMIVTVT